MKKLLSVSIAAFAFAAVADPVAYSPITVEVRNITPSVQNTIIPVPVTTIGSADPISVHDLVKAANLPDDTMLYYFDGTNYKAWKKDNTGAWITPDISATIGSAAVSAGSTTIHVSVGAALWVSFPANTILSDQTIVVYGAPVTTKTSTIAVGTNLLANPTGAAVDGTILATKLANITPVKGDKITYLGGSSYSGYFTYTGSVWKKVAGKNITEGLDDLPANGGFWYISKGGAGIINW